LEPYKSVILKEELEVNGDGFGHRLFQVIQYAGGNAEEVEHHEN
jgi:hypothetical protein